MIFRLSTLWLASLAISLTPAFAQENSFGPFSPEEAARNFVLHPDCRIQLVASEPDVIDPVHIAFNTDGKLWVVEMTDYPNGPADGQPGLSRIRVLSDDDGDGRYTNPVTFAEKLLFANGLMFWKDGVIVTTDGKIQFMRDTNGDGQADETQVWFQGFATENPQLRHNHPQLAMDCKIYVANGLRGGDILPGPDNPWGLDPKSAPLSISGRDFRFDPLTGKYEAISGMGQFGMTFDDSGNRFVCTNRNPCRQIILEDEQLKLTPGLRIPRFYEDVAAAGEDSKLYPLSRTWTTSNLHANQFTAACGVLIFQDTGLDFLGDIFTCDPTANLVHLEVIHHKQGPTFEASPESEGIEFLATRDEWFRPVNLSHGPDGSLYVVDMYRAVIEHPQFMPVELKDRPDLTLGLDKGRIWRVRSQTRQPNTSPNLANANTDTLLTAAQNHSPWLRNHAHRLILENYGAETLELIRKRNSTDLGASRGFLLHLLHQSRQMTFDDLKTSWNAPGSRSYLRTILQLGEMEFASNPKWYELLNHKIANDADQVLNNAAYDILGFVPWETITDENQTRILNHLIENAVREDSLEGQIFDPYWLSTYLGLSARSDSFRLLEDLLNALQGSTSTQLLAPVVHNIAELVARQNQVDQVDTLLLSIPLNGALDDVTKMAVLAGFAEGVPGGSASLRGRIAKLQGEQNDAIQHLFQVAAQQFAAPSLAPQLLSIITSLLSVDLSDKSLHLLVVATGSGDAHRASLALTALLKRPAEQANPALLELLPNRRGSVRRSILQAMASNVSRAPALLDEIEAGQVPVLEIDETTEKMFYRLADKAVVARAQKLLKRAPPADRVQVLADYQECLTMPSDPQRGKAIFEKNCATCHKIGEIGVNVAPDISDSRTKTPDFYLMNILDPNRAIDANYFSFNILDTDGRVHTGIVDSETSTAITLKQPEGKLVTIPRDQVEEYKNNGVSLMPVGLERTINKQQMADIISFIKNWRYLDGQIPVEVIK